MTELVPTATPEDAVSVLYDLACGGPYLERLPEGLTASADTTVDDGLALQARVIERWRGAGETIGGWKVGWTSRKQRDSRGADFRPFGYIIGGRVLRSGAVISREGIVRGQVEAEICLTIGQRLSGDVTRDQAYAAVASVSPAFEINARRLANNLSLAAASATG